MYGEKIDGNRNNTSEKEKKKRKTYKNLKNKNRKKIEKKKHIRLPHWLYRGIKGFIPTSKHSPG